LEKFKTYFESVVQGKRQQKDNKSPSLLSKLYSNTKGEYT